MRSLVWIGLLGCTSCRDLSGFATNGDSYEGAIVKADFVRTGIDADASACITLDIDHLQGAPGQLWTTDGRFHATPMRPIPQLWHDPLSTLSFGEGRLKNLIYVATTTPAFADGSVTDVFVVVSLLHSGDVEVRLLSGAPSLEPDGAATSAQTNSLFAVFALSRQKGACSF